MENRWQRFWNCRDGNFGLITALLIVPLLGAAGLAIDFSNALSVRTQLFTAADAAAVGSIAEKSPAFKAAVAMSSDGAVAVGPSDAKNLFFAQRTVGIEADKVNVDVSVTKKGVMLQSNVTFNASIPTTFLRILGRDTIKISGTATAEYQTATFIDFYMLLDNTPSMGVGATSADVAMMVAATAKNKDDANCAFACHIVSETGVEDKNSYYNLARNIGATIRIDVVAKATKALAKNASDPGANRFRMAAYTFGQTAMDANLYTVSKLTSDLAAVAKATENITLMSIPRQGYKDDQLTSFDEALTKIDKEIDTAGDGSSNTQPQKIVYFVGDGVGDSNKPKGCTKKLKDATRCIEPIDTSYCKKLKDRKIKIAVLYTTYLPLPTNGFYNYWIAPFQTSIGSKMEECASPDLYFEVSPTDGIDAAMKALFQKAVASARITS
ncbi:TadE/TadG family type IV pilus assembly protein [Rhizobium tubonense]|uniref:Putative Flp pilus-assembly TadG-like N-terminal domain-containing protein n=1 Tax=Rhizobium tubonense TaxID=484088 RepID=A0A2W4CKA8_9HYPH|nr:TadE/TadG family type IV pilus assembly protein [Rhizobium tubonense]PZM13081.1 hypothetical protein CPY51_16360 [Rhizobium tubonense]